MSIVDEAIVWGKRIVDPWYRMTSCPKNIITVIEFCQVQGPRPLYSYPVHTCNQHLDLDNVALWLMSAEVIIGSSTIVYNQQMAVYACVHYSTIFDLYARAFQRPISIALLSSLKPSAAVFKEFIEISKRLLTPLLVCNQTLFRSHLTRLIGIAKTIDIKLYEEKKKVSKSAVIKVQSLAEQGKRLLKRLENSAFQKVLCDSRCCKGHELTDTDIKFLEFLNDNPSPLLQQVQFLAPCAYDEFIKEIANAYEKLSRIAHSPQSGTLFCAAVPILKLKDCYNHSLNSGESGASLVKMQDENDYIRNLTTITEGLDKILFALLSGEDLALWSVEERKSLGKDLLKKINLLRVCMQAQSAPWKGEYDNSARDCQLFGESVPWKTTVNDSSDASLCVYDVEGRWLKCRNYKGKMLNFLSSKRSDSFPTDYALIQYVMSQLTDFCSVLYLAYYSDLNKLREHLKLEEDDFSMVLNLLAQVNVLKYGKMKEKVKECKSAGMIIVKV
ncbi:unnamed protein product [Thelazia callipaeda]|uniref:UDENN FLCN/SMCR8-type domain-containing protein n=1 Tax=Thelazia callipaeda TaxID=103827 RepID=A0A0N5CXK3_THECL|nr:unnamed protein product [Thelazia callipaeda]